MYQFSFLGFNECTMVKQNVGKVKVVQGFPALALQIL